MTDNLPYENWGIEIEDISTTPIEGPIENISTTPDANEIQASPLHFHKRSHSASTEDGTIYKRPFCPTSAGKLRRNPFIIKDSDEELEVEENMSQVVDRDTLKELKGVFNSFGDSVSDEVKGLERLVGNEKKR